MDKSPIEKACGIAGGQAKLADAVGVTPQAVNQWVTKGAVPPERVLSVEAATEGQVTRYELRPDIYGKPPVAVPSSKSAAQATLVPGEST